MDPLPDDFPAKVSALFESQLQWKGSALGDALRKLFPSVDFKLHGGLSALIPATLPAVRYDRERDILFVGTLGAPPPEATVPLWLAYTSPKQGFELALTDAGEIAAVKRGQAGPNMKVIGCLSDEDYAGIAKAFCEQAPEDKREMLQGAANSYSFARWSSAVNGAGVLSSWMLFRNDRIRKTLSERLENLAVPEERRRALVSRVESAKTREGTAARTASLRRTETPDLRTKVVEVVGRMSDTELDALWLPVRAIRTAGLF